LVCLLASLRKAGGNARLSPRLPLSSAHFGLTLFLVPKLRVWECQAAGKLRFVAG
jgi:hypothetical protein